MLGASCSECCEVCQQYTFFVNWGPDGGFRPFTATCYGDDAKFGGQTVKVPDGVTLPVTVRITGSADDDLAVDGKTVSVDSAGKPKSCRVDGPVEASFCLNKKSFEIAAIDNYGWIASYDVKVCFVLGVPCNPLP